MAKRIIYIVEALACGYEETVSRNVCAYTDLNEATMHASKASAVAEEYQEQLTTVYELWQSPDATENEAVFEERWGALERCVDGYKNPYDARAFIVESREVATYFVRELELYEGKSPE